MRENSGRERTVARFRGHVHLKRAWQVRCEMRLHIVVCPTNVVSLRNAPSDGLVGMRSWLPSLGSTVVQREDGWRGVLRGLCWWKTPHLASSPLATATFPLARSCISVAAGVGESTRGCRLEADKIREESRLSNPRWLSSLLVSLPLRKDLAAGGKRDAVRLAHWIGGQLYRSAFSVVAHTRYPSTIYRSKQHVKDVIILDVIIFERLRFSSLF